MSDWTEAAINTAIRARKAQQAVNDLGAGPDATVRVSADVHRQLLTLQYQRKMAGESVSLSDIIGQLLEKASAA